MQTVIKVYSIKFSGRFLEKTNIFWSTNVVKDVHSFGDIGLEKSMKVYRVRGSIENAQYVIDCTYEQCIKQSGKSWTSKIHSFSVQVSSDNVRIISLHASC